MSGAIWGAILWILRCIARKLGHKMLESNEPRESQYVVKDGARVNRRMNRDSPDRHEGGELEEDVEEEVAQEELSIVADPRLEDA